MGGSLLNKCLRFGDGVFNKGVPESKSSVKTGSDDGLTIVTKASIPYLARMADEPAHFTTGSGNP